MPARLRLVDLVGYGLQTGGHLHEICPDRVLGREFGEPPTVRGLLAKKFAEVSHRVLLVVIVLVGQLFAFQRRHTGAPLQSSDASRPD